MKTEKRTHVYRSTLANEFGLTNRMIDKLGPPDKVVPNKHYRSGPGAQLYSVKRVSRWIARNRSAVEAAKQRRERKPEAKECDLLAAIFAVNRAAKRHRDAAQVALRVRTSPKRRQCQAEKE
jgi:phage terminase Nu1 subunit (DNA packaging protein)